MDTILKFYIKRQIWYLQFRHSGAKHEHWHRKSEVEGRQTSNSEIINTFFLHAVYCRVVYIVKKSGDRLMLGMYA